MFFHKKSLIVFICIFILSAFFSACSTNKIKSSLEPISRTEFFLGTVVTVQLYDNANEEIFNKIFKELKEIEDRMTINADDSEVIKINFNAGKNFVKVSDDTFYVIEKGKYFSEISKGRFDISIGPLVKLWNIGSEEAHVPSQDEIDSKLALVNYKDVLLNESEKSVMLKNEGMILDLGGIAKGYAADAIVKILKESNVDHAIINLGGNVFAYGTKPDGSNWRIGIQDPSSSRGDYIGIVNIVNKTVVTSGVYERFFVENGKHYHHILDPETGYPVENNLLSVSIIADKSIDADSLSTSVFSLGLENGMDLIENLDNAEAIFITKNSDVYITSGLKNNFELTSKNFKLRN